MTEVSLGFETKGKSKLPKDMVFPTSAHVLQEKLVAVPQKTEVSVYCWYHKPMTSRRQQKTWMGRAHRSVRDSSRDIFEVTHQRSAVSLHTPNLHLDENSRMNSYTQDKWKLTVRAVPIGDLQAIRQCLEEEGYSKLRDWFVKTNEFAGSIGYHRLTVAFDGKNLKYLQNDQL
jgi:hypothetical protein